MNIFVLYNQEYLIEIRAVNTTVSITIFVFCFIAFVVFRRKFSSMSRSFVNPLGDFSAIYGSGVFIIAWVATLFYNPVDKMFLVGLAGYWFACAVFFCTYLVHNQKFSEEEKKVMFKAYLINANRKKRLNMLRNNKVGVIATGSVTDKPSSNTGGVRSSANSHGTSLQEIPKPCLNNEDSVPSKPSNEEKKDEARMASSVATSSRSSQPEPVVNVSSKIIAFFSSKMNAIAPVMNQMGSNKECNDYEQLAVLAAGGIMDESLEEALKARFGTEDDDVEVGNIEMRATEAI